MKKLDKPESAQFELARLLRDCRDREQPYQYLLNLQNSMRAIGFKDKDTLAAIQEHESRRRLVVRRKHAKDPIAYEVHANDSLWDWLERAECRRQSPKDDRNEWMLLEYGGTKTPIQEIWEEANRRFPKHQLYDHRAVVPTLTRYCRKVGKEFPHRRR